MKKFLALLFVFAMVLALAACNPAEKDDSKETKPAATDPAETNPAETNPAQTNPAGTDPAETDPAETDPAETDPAETDPTDDPETEGGEQVDPNAAMTYDEYVAADMDAEVVIEAYVQATQSWWDNKIVAYLQDKDGAYFAYNMACTEDDAAKLVPGTKIRVTGYKGEYSGEVEILDATFTFVEGADTYIAPATDVTAVLSNETELIKHMNKFVSFKGLTVVASKDANGNDVPFLYKWNGSGEDGDDLYFNVSDGTNTYSFTVESYLCGKDTAVYQAVKELKIGDVIDAEGFLYWYNGVNPHITSVAPAAPAARDYMTYDEYVAADMDAEVVIEAYVQATQSWWDNKIVAYLQDKDGAYFAYNMACTEDDAAKLVPGTKIRVTGYKGEYSGEVEILDATFTFVEGADTYIAPATDVTAVLSNETELIKHMNKFVSFKGLTVVASKDANGNDVPFLYKWNGSGEDGDDLYFNVSDGTNTYSFTVESYLCGKDTAVYQAVKALKIGDVIDAEGFLYWYNGVNPHITSVTAAE